jgi:predicted SAM-dependent methyltransferase
MTILDLGCGAKKRPGAITVDISKKYLPDVIHDLNRFPYPFKKSCADLIYLDNVLEHLDDVVGVMSELYRICRPGGQVVIAAPYFRSIYGSIDPTHKHFFTVSSMGYFDQENKLSLQYQYSEADFHIEKVVFEENFPHKTTRRWIVALANRYPYHYEYHFSHLFPLDAITYYLRKKSASASRSRG